MNCNWELAKATLWPGKAFPKAEEKETKKIIKSYLINETDPYKAYLELCQRILLVFKRVTRRGPVIRETPSEYFNPGNGSGFALSAPWFAAIQQNRGSDPLHEHAIKAFCEAILDMTEDPCEEIFCFWLNWFRNREASAEYRLFYSCRIKTNSTNPLNQAS